MRDRRVTGRDLAEENAEEMRRDRDGELRLLRQRRGWFKDERPVHLTAREKWGLRSATARNSCPPTTCKSLDADAFPGPQMGARASPARHPDRGLRPVWGCRPTRTR